MEKIYLTGDRPTGKLHLGHYVGSLKNRVAIQELENTQQFIMIADQQALTDNADNPLKIQKSVREVILDYLAVGLDPAKSTIFIQSKIPQLSELMMYYLNLVTVSRLYRNPTVKSEMKEKNFETSLPAGFLTYPVSQAADITAFKATHVPVGGDQLPMIEQTKEIVRSFNRIYNTDCLIEPEIVLPKKNQERLKGIDGQGKMSKSLNNGIYLSDDEATIKKKIMSMYTDPNHIHVSDPGQVEGNMVFEYLDIFSTDKNEVEQLKQHYREGGLGDVKIKNYLNEILQETLLSIRLKRNEFEKDDAYLMEILKTGSLKAEERATETLDEVKRAMGINYF
ncbi:tryptophan--tRNA ligase [Vagococcus carniphilus]|uniref:tryptophan--tRNA ligase n=1 Tax=Vagococcus carniphilus TaxID=218144 RepID=UPI0028905479|nr:tryptophan--tRNA ligase [Vagococcus carniphilus]MDT2830469.1 tryptophan--tRNA ligase [Vagococcus carniphilus]MDT2839962.1 tryptophan--tRNA ligase [Vagococcus carniphilus]MDT2854453.1 tryptophan--tRNA ligase [Vagococcus carniphilus]